MDEFAGVVNTFDELIKCNAGIIDAIGDCPNIEVPVNRDSVFWKRIETKCGYECQMNVLSGKCRVVSPSGIRLANGSKNVMLEKMKRLTATDFLKAGDVIGVSRKGLYEHYAVYLGKGRVIHYSEEGNDLDGTISVHEADISEFKKDSKSYFVVWFDNGIPYKIQSETTFLFKGSLDHYNGVDRRTKRKTFSAKETVARAKSRVGETEYNLITNNCEHFAMWCKTGVSESSQVKKLLNAAVASGVREYGYNSPEALLCL